MKSRNVSRRPLSQKQKRRSFLGSATKTNRSPFAHRGLRFEQLEDRRVLAFINIAGGDGSIWDINDTIVTTNGLPAGGSATSTSAGGGASINDASIPGQGDAFDQAAMVWVNNTQVVGALSQSGNTVTFAPQVIAGLNAQLQYYFASSSATARILVTLSNPSGSPITVPIDYATNLGSDSTTVINGTSSGDAILDPADRWIVTDDAFVPGDPANTTVIEGPGTPAVAPSAVSTTVFSSAGPEGIRATYNLTIAPGQTRSMMWFQQMNDTTANALADAPTFFDTNPPEGGDLLSGLTAVQLSQIANWAFAGLTGNIVVNGSGIDDTLILTATGPDAGSYSLNGAPAVFFSAATSFTFNGLVGNDLFRINNPAGGLFAPSGGIFYDGGGQPGDSIENLGGSATSGIYTPGPTTDAGVITHTNGAVTQTISFTGLAPATDTVTEATFTVNAPDSSNSILVDNGTALGDGLIRVSIDAFEPISFSNKTNVVVNGGTTAADAADIVTLSNTEASTGLATLRFNGGPGTVGDVIFVRNTVAGVTTTVDGQDGTDFLQIEGFDGTLNSILGPVAVIGGAGAADTLLVSDVLATAGRIFTIDANSVGGAPAAITYDSTTEILNVNGGSGADTYNVSSSPTTTYNLDANAPSIPPGDTLNFDAQGLSLTSNGAQFTQPGRQAVNYTDFETVNATNLAALTVEGDAANNTLTLRRIALDTFTYQLDATPLVTFSRPTSAGTQFTFNGNGGDDTFIVNNSSFSDLVNLRTAYNGGTNNAPGAEASGPPGDTLVITGQETDGGIVARETYLVGDTQDAGTWILDRDGSRGPGASLAGNGDELVVTFTGLEPVDSDTPAAVFDVVYDAGDADSIRVENGGLLNGSQSIRVVDLSGTFETFRFANKTLVRLHLNDLADTAHLNYTIPAVGLTTLEIYGHGVAGVGADDNAADHFRLDATANNAAVGPAFDTSLFGQGGNDRFNNFSAVTPGGNNSLASLSGRINLDGGAGADDEIGLNASADAGPIAATLTSTQLSGAAPGTIDYVAVEEFSLGATSAADTIDILSSALGTAYLISGLSGSDTITIGNSTADFAANNFDGSLAAIDGPIDIAPDGLGAVGTDTLNVDASGDVALAGAASITNIGGDTFLYGALSNTGNTTRLENFASAFIDYRHAATAGGLMDDAANRLENLNVRTSTGNDVVVVNHTTAVTQTTLDTRQGNDTVTINGDNLSAANLFRGLGAPSVADGNDFFTLNITANLGAGAFAPLTSVQIEGNNQLAGIDGRDRLLINDNSAAARNLNYHYLAAGSGDLDIEAVGGAGLAGAVVPGLALQVRTMESVSFDAAGANNDTVQVTGIVAVDDILTVVPFSEASGQTLVYRGGTPYLGAPPATIVGARPGVSGGGAGPDLAIDGIAPAGITVDGGGNSGAAVSGDQVVVHGFSENQINNGGTAPIFSGSFAALGAGVIQPAVAVGTAYDDILVTQALVDITNVGVGQLLLVNVNTATFTQNNPLPPADERAGLLVNGGDEVGTRPNGVADDFFVTVSSNFNIKVNGNLPDPAIIGPDGLPRGDQLNFSGPGSLNIFSDKATPPNVQVQFGGSTFGVQYSSIERFAANLGPSPANGTANLIGDNNNPSAASNQPDNFVVRGRDVDGDFTDAGYQEMTVSINGSAPILLNGIRYLKVYGDDLQGTFDPANLNTNDTSVDTLDIRAFADNVPTGWGVDVFFNEGAPAQADGLQQDLIIYHTATGVAAPPDVFGAGTVSEDIIVQPTGPDNGEIRSTNAADGSLIYVLSYVNNTDIVFIDDDGVPGNGVPPGPPPPAGTTYDALSDVDSLTLRGTNPNNGYTSGSERFDINITSVLGTPATPVISVRDNATGAILYRVREFRTQTQVAGVTDASDFLALNDSNPGSLVYTTITLDPMGGNDIVQVDDPATPAPLATDVLDGESILLFTSIDVGAGNDRVNLSRTTLALPGAATLTTQIYGGEGDDTLIGSPYIDRIYGGVGNDTLIGRQGADNEYGEEGNDLFGDQLAGVGGISNLTADDAGNDQMFGGAGSDRFVWDPGDNNDTMEGGAGESDQLVFFGNGAAETFAFTQNGTRLTFTRSVGAVTLDVAGVDQVTLQTGGGADIVTINDITQTDVRSIDVNLANADGTADAAVDNITVFGREVADSVAILAPSAGVLAITGLKYDINIRNAVAANDVFTFNAVGGNDTVFTADDLSAQFTTANFTVNGGLGNDTISGYGTLNGDAGDDTLVGGSLANVISGGAGNDTINGGGGDDALNGNDGEDTFVGGTGNDTIDGGNDYDTILVLGTSSNDTITANQTTATSVTYTVTPSVGTASVETDILVTVAGVRTVEELHIVAGAGDDTIVVTAADALGVDGVVNALLFNVDGGPANTRDRLSVQDNGTGDLLLYRQGTTFDSGSISVGPGNAEPLETVFTGIERVDPIAGTGGAIRFFKLDTLEWNDNIANATHLGADETINVDPNIDPGAVVVPGFAPLPADNDFFRIVAERTGTLDIQVYFTQLLTVPSGRPGLPNAGNLDIELYDVDGTLIVDGVLGGLDFGINDATDNERIRIPAVAGQTYYLRVLPNGTAINTYSITTINTAAPVPFDIELLDTPLNLATNATPGAPGATAVGVSSDTGRSRFDDITFDNDPTILIRVPNVIQVGGLSFLDDIPANGNGVTPGSPPDETILIPFVTSTVTNAPSAGFRVAVFVTENNTTDAVLAGYAQPILGRPGVFTFTFANDALAPDGSYFISSSVEMIDPTAPEQNQGFGELAESLEIIVDTILPPVSFGSPGIGNDGLILSDDCPTPLINLTNIARPTFWGRAEADTVINLYLDSNNNGLFDPATDVFLGQTVATPFDGGDQYPNGYWEIESRLSLNDPSLILPVPGVLPLDGPRTLFITAEDVAGNITGTPTAIALQIVLDTQGPQVTDVDVNNAGNPYDLFDPKPSTDGPTPLVNSLVISFQDLPARVAGTLYAALADGSDTAGLITLIGDYNGIIPILDTILVNNPPVAGSPATATIELVFRTPGPDGIFNTTDDVGKPLPDDRFTLNVSDEITDPLCNKLDGESNASEPQENPTFPSGNGIRGGDFVARFTVDSRAEVGTWGAGAAWIDTNGNTTFDQNNPDFTNRDITYYLGYTSDNLFAGNFVKAPGGVADGFDKLAAYGRVGTQWRWLVDVDNDGVITPGVDIAVVDPAGINGLPVAGNFDGNVANGDEVGVFTGTTWYFDTNHDFKVELGSAVAWSQSGYPVVGNYDGVAGDDLATYRDNTFFIDFGRNGTVDRTFRFGFPTPNNRPVSADVDRDGHDDLGLFVPNRAGVSPHEDAEWYILVSGGARIVNRIHADPIDGVPVINYKPVPFGNDIFIQYGDEFGMPILGNFDPPVTPGGRPGASFPSSNPSNPLDVNNDGFVTPIDALLVINEINANGSHTLETTGFHTAPFIDTDRDNVVSPHDVLLVINHLNAQQSGGSGEEGEGESFAPASAHDEIFGEIGAIAPVTSASDGGIISLLADEQVRAKRSRQAE
ncbi:MAG: dockerin type I domain-containing protein [Pirellulaceae bacterium]